MADGGNVLKPIIRSDVVRPLYVCGCGWTSYDKRYDLAFHAYKHGCKKVNKNG